MNEIEAIVVQLRDEGRARRPAEFLASEGEASDAGLYAWFADDEGRADLGNTHPGDGGRFMGRGLIEITGRRNYTLAAVALGLDLLNDPELLEEPVNAARSAAWFWSARGLNGLADSQQFIAITRRVNGGINGLAERQKLYAAAKHALGC